MSITIQERQNFLEHFRQVWPIQRLKALKLEEYTSVGDKNSLVYWLEFGAGRYLGSIKGGDSSKFGIYERKAEPKGHRDFISSDERYSWKSKYGGSAKEAFSLIKQNIIAVIEAIQTGDLTTIEELDFESALKWKLAFIYQDHSKPCVLPIYKLNKFNSFMAGKPSFTHADAYSTLMRNRGAKSALEYGFEIWQRADALEGKKKTDFDAVDVEEISYDGHKTTPLNQIFYGPPGTGKTYVTIEAAVKAAEPTFVWEERHNLKARYDELVAAGRIRFVTFHQSFSYEDFVEGLSADAADGKVSYEKRAGIFKELVEDAKASKEEGAEVFDAAWQKMLDMLVASDDELTMETVRGKKFKVAFEGNKTFRVYPQESQNENPYYVASVSNVRKLYYGASKKGMYNPSYVVGMLNFLKRKCGLPEKPPSKQTKKLNFVLVIDEINRGNISRIFGELITLIEPSKRIGAAEALEVTLPLTGDKFGVPDNLYIIGTMNTADRSLAGLDLALRRRFTFVEMPPKPDLLDGLIVGGNDGIDIGEMLRVMNQRITALLDRDHCIGHAYFMPLLDKPSLELLADIFAQNILPLLQEYFFEDWQRIGWVLADQTKPDSFAFIVKEQNMDAQQLFPGVSQFKPRECRRINTDALMQVEAYQRIYKQAPAASEQDQ